MKVPILEVDSPNDSSSSEVLTTVEARLTRDVGRAPSCLTQTSVEESVGFSMNRDALRLRMGVV